MSRRIRTVTLQSVDGAETKRDDFADRIIKLIPGDVVAAWIAIISGVKAANAQLGSVAFWVVFGILVAAAAAWTWRKTRIPGTPPAVKQTVVSTIAFGVWAYATTGEHFPSVAGYPLYTPLWGTIVLSVFTVLSGMLSEP